MTAQFIDTAYLKSTTVIEDSVDDDKLQPMIIKAQDIHIQYTLGSSFMQHLFFGVINNSLSVDEVTLINEYIARCLAEWTLYEALPFLNMKITNKAVSQSSSEYSKPSQLTEVKYLRASVKDVAEFYSERLKTYLCDHSDLFPKWVNPDKPENLKKSGKSYSSGIYFPSKSGCKNC